MAYTQSDIEGALPLLTSGKVRDLYEVNPSTLLFVATDRISAYDVIMENVSLPSRPILKSTHLEPQLLPCPLHTPPIDSFTNAQPPPHYNRASQTKASSSPS